jgi:hypothetical protein
MGTPSMNSNPENELIQRCRRGDSQAWDELSDRYYAVSSLT